MGAGKKRRKQEEAERKAREEELKKLKQAIKARHGEGDDEQEQGEAEG